MINWWIPAALQKEIIESTKINECKNGCIGIDLALRPPHALQLLGQGALDAVDALSLGRGSFPCRPMRTNRQPKRSGRGWTREAKLRRVAARVKVAHVAHV